MTKPVPRPPATLPPDVRAAVEVARRVQQERRAPSSRRAYRTDWAIFATWCDRFGLETLPATPATVNAFLGAQIGAGIAPATLGRRLAAIRAQHLERGYATPTADDEIAATMAGWRRATPREVRKKKALLPADLRTLLAAVPTDALEGLRDRALILVGFAGAFRRSELVRIRVEELERRPEGVVVAVPRSKTDQERRGRRVPVIRGTDLCPVAALDAWLGAAEITSGPVFRSFTPRGTLRDVAMGPEIVARKLKRYARAAGLSPAEVDRLGGHSLRAGFVTAALANGADVFRVMEVTGHVSVQTVKEYVRSAKPFYDHAGEGLL